MAILDRRAEILQSTSPIVEYQAVLTRPAFLAETGIAAEDVLAILDNLAGLCVPVAFDYHWRPLSRDASDDLVLETSINGGAHAIATFNIADGAPRFNILPARPAALLNGFTHESVSSPHAKHQYYGYNPMEQFWPPASATLFLLARRHGVGRSCRFIKGDWGIVIFYDALAVPDPFKPQPVKP